MFIIFVRDRHHLGLVHDLFTGQANSYGSGCPKHLSFVTLGLTARGYHRVLRVARTLADLEASENVHRLHIAEALSHRRARKGLSPERQNLSAAPYRA